MPEVSRRQALKACLACAMAAPALPRLAHAMLTASPSGLYVIRLAQHPELNTVGGSKAFTVAGAPGDAHELVVTRLGNGSGTTAFAAVSAYCTHEGVLVNVYDPRIQRIVCSAHGSEFSATGAVLKSPARSNLTRYTATFDAAAGTVTLDLPGYTPTAAESAELAEALSLSAAPNPARGAVGIRVHVPAPMPARVAVYDAAGALVAVLADGPVTPQTTLVWEPGDAAPGVYAVHLATPAGTRTALVTRVR